jgi:regulator of sigma E protease
MLTFILILSVLILVHELGHYLMAKASRVRVEKFSLGFGPKLFSRKIGETEYMLCAIPFGGFIKMAGDSAEEFKGAPDEFLSRPPGQRARIIAAGPVFNYILAFLCLWMVYFLGYPRFTTKIGELIAGMPAQAAGLQVGDTIVAVNGEKVRYWEDLSRAIRAEKGKTLHLTVARGPKEVSLDLTPEAKEVATPIGKKVEVGLIGIRPTEDIILVRYGLGEALVRGFKTLVDMTVTTLSAICYIIVGTMSFRESVTGPLGIFFIATNAAKVGFSAILHVIGILSMSLSVFNLLPLPVLDGGHIFLTGLEKLRRRPLSRRVEDAVSNVGLSFLILLAVFIFFNDLIRYGYWDRVMALFSR